MLFSKKKQTKKKQHSLIPIRYFNILCILLISLNRLNIFLVVHELHVNLPVKPPAMLAQISFFFYSLADFGGHFL